MITKIIAIDEVVCQVTDNSVIMVGGFGPHGYPKKIILALNEKSNAKDLHFVVNAPNQFTRPELEQLLQERCSELVCSYMLHSTAAKELFKQEKVRALPQGTFAESIRAGGMGIPGYYTNVGIGTYIEEGKDTSVIDGKIVILEKAIKGDFAFIRADVVDTLGNCYLKGANRNFSVHMAMACENVIIEAKKIVEPGTIDPEFVSIPGILVDGIVDGGAYV